MLMREGVRHCSFQARLLLLPSAVSLQGSLPIYQTFRTIQPVKFYFNYFKEQPRYTFATNKSIILVTISTF